MSTIDQTPLLHNAGGPPSAALRWNGLRNVQPTPKAAAEQGRLCWIRLHYDFIASERIPESMQDEAILPEKIDSLGDFLVSKGLLQPVQIVSSTSVVDTPLELPRNLWLIWCLLTKSTEHAWMQRRAPQMSRIATRFSDVLVPGCRHIWRICVSTTQIDPDRWTEALSEWEAS